MPTTRLSTLFNRFLSQQCSSAEKQELAELILDKTNAAEINELLEQTWEDTEGETHLTNEKWEQLFHSIVKTEPTSAAFSGSKN